MDMLNELLGVEGNEGLKADDLMPNVRHQGNTHPLSMALDGILILPTFLLRSCYIPVL